VELNTLQVTAERQRTTQSKQADAVAVQSVGLLENNKNDQ
jgi:hypothetical protein